MICWSELFIDFQSALGAGILSPWTLILGSTERRFDMKWCCADFVESHLLEYANSFYLDKKGGVGLNVRQLSRSLETKIPLSSSQARLVVVRPNLEILACDSRFL